MSTYHSFLHQTTWNQNKSGGFWFIFRGCIIYYRLLTDWSSLIKADFRAWLLSYYDWLWIRRNICLACAQPLVLDELLCHSWHTTPLEDGTSEISIQVVAHMGRWHWKIRSAELGIHRELDHEILSFRKVLRCLSRWPLKWQGAADEHHVHAIINLGPSWECMCEG